MISESALHQNGAVGNQSNRLKSSLHRSVDARRTRELNE
jgi:hypothetical protein